MIQIKFNDKLYPLPSNWDEVKIYQFQDIKKLDYTELGKLKYIIKLVQIFTGLPEEVIINSNAKALEQIYEVINFIYKVPLTNKMTDKFTIGDDIYTLKEFNELTTGERISLEVLLEGEVDDVFPEIMSILFRRNDETFDISKMDSIADDIATEVGIGQLYGTLLFFCEVEKTFLNNIHTYSEVHKEMQKIAKMKKMERMIYKVKKKFKQMLGYIGGTLLIRWQAGTSWTMRKFTKTTL